MVEINLGFSNVLRSLAKLLRSLKKLCIPSQRYLCSLAKPLCSLAKLVYSLAKIFTFPRKTFAFSRKTEFGQTLPVYFTACKLVVHTARTFTMERFIEFYFKLGLKFKYSQLCI